jgi:hypothetical protein
MIIYIDLILFLLKTKLIHSICLGTKLKVPESLLYSSLGRQKSMCLAAAEAVAVAGCQTLA